LDYDLLKKSHSGRQKYNFGGGIAVYNPAGVILNNTSGERVSLKPYLLLQNYLNPFNSMTTISYRCPKTSIVNLTIYDILGRKVIILVNEQKPASTYNINFNAEGLASGIYFCRRYFIDLEI
jgi:hypothetical protein